MTHEQRRQRRIDIAAASTAGMSVERICFLFGVSYHSVRCACWEHGAQMPERARPQDVAPPPGRGPSRTLLLLCAIQKGLSLRDAAKSARTTYEYARQVEMDALELGLLSPNDKEKPSD